MRVTCATRVSYKRNRQIHFGGVRRPFLAVLSNLVGYFKRAVEGKPRSQFAIWTVRAAQQQMETEKEQLTDKL